MPCVAAWRGVANVVIDLELVCGVPAATGSDCPANSQTVNRVWI